MEKIIINHAGSGIKTLRIISSIFLWLGLFGAFGLLFVVIILSNNHESEKAISFAASSIIGLIILIFLCFISKAIATIAENSLYQKSYLLHKTQKEEIVFEDTNPYV